MGINVSQQQLEQQPNKMQNIDEEQEQYNDIELIENHHNHNNNDMIDIEIDDMEYSNGSENSALNRPTIQGPLTFIPLEQQQKQNEYEEKQLDYFLNGIEWGGSNQDKRRFTKAFSEALRCVDIPGRAKLIIVQRYIRMVNHFRHLRKKWKIFSYSSRVIVTIGSLIVPCLILIDDQITERGQIGQIIAYLSLAIGFTVTVVNGLQELYQSTKQYITSSNTEELLTTEGWAFVTLSGKYEKYETHQECWQHFFDRVQKINSGAHHVHMSLARRPGDDAGHMDTHNKQTNDIFMNTGTGNNGENNIYGFNDDDEYNNSPVVYANH